MIFSSLSTSLKNNNSSLSAASDSSQNRKPLSRSSQVSKCTGSQDLEAQVSVLKEKAHQSFMQVIQIQQLHEEEIDQIQAQFAEKEQAYRREIQTLTSKLQILEQESRLFDRNLKHHLCQFEGEDFSIPDIEPIDCQDDSRLDDSAIVTFIELVAAQTPQEALKVLRDQVNHQLSALVPQSSETRRKFQEKLDKIFDCLLRLKQELSSLQQKEKNRTKGSEPDQLALTSRNQLEKLDQENKFMGEQIRRLTSEKIHFQRRAFQAEKKVKSLEQKGGEGSTKDTKGTKWVSPVVRQTCSKVDEPEGECEGEGQLRDFLEQHLRGVVAVHRSTKPMASWQRVKR